MGRLEDIKALHRKTTGGAKMGLAFRYFSRPLASVLLSYVGQSRLTPNQVTILSLVAALLGSVVHATVLSWGGLVAGGVLFMVAHVLDALDGQLARHRNAGSELGRHFDYFTDGLKAYVVYVAITVRLWRQLGSEDPGFAPFGGSAGDPLLVLRPIAAALGADGVLLVALAALAALAAGIACTDFMKRPEWKEAFTAGGGGRSRGVALAEATGRFVVDYPSYILLLCVLNRVDLYFVLYSLVVVVHALRSLAGIAARLWRIDPYRR